MTATQARRRVVEGVVHRPLGRLGRGDDPHVATDRAGGRDTTTTRHRPDDASGDGAPSANAVRWPAPTRPPRAPAIPPYGPPACMSDGNRDRHAPRRRRHRPSGPAPGSSCRPTTRPRTCAAIAAAILESLPGATLLVVDDSSPDGTGDLADAAGGGRPADPGPAPAGEAGPGQGVPRRVRRRARGRGGDRDPDGRRLVARPGRAAGPHRPDRRGRARTSSSARATPRAAASRTGASSRRIISRGGSLFARIVLGLGPHDLTGGFKAWRAPTLGAVPFDGVHAGGYVFQIEMTYRASRPAPGSPRCRSRSGTGGSASRR